MADDTEGSRRNPGASQLVHEHPDHQGAAVLRTNDTATGTRLSRRQGSPTRPSTRVQHCVWKAVMDVSPVSPPNPQEERDVKRNHRDTPGTCETDPKGGQGRTQDSTRAPLKTLAKISASLFCVGQGLSSRGHEDGTVSHDGCAGRRS
ncbi:hypothetical protein NHX12_013049 [Muraenolepis orangiensis]|uniref:Uncharacterized protein n=1 Tax=Muraenolepis orangiensis TaxID=630683 RepID=A0A9Q0DFL8_9TELE|nr:hypothetical protein NHX12_013049 [Muraenolepis orangiensis]